MAAIFFDRLWATVKDLEHGRVRPQGIAKADKASTRWQSATAAWLTPRLIGLQSREHSFLMQPILKSLRFEIPFDLALCRSNTKFLDVLCRLGQQASHLCYIKL